MMKPARRPLVGDGESFMKVWYSGKLIMLRELSSSRKRKALMGSSVLTAKVGMPLSAREACT